MSFGYIMPFGYIFGKHFANALRDLAVSMEFLIALRPGSAGRVRTGPCGERMRDQQPGFPRDRIRTSP